MVVGPQAEVRKNSRPKQKLAFTRKSTSASQLFTT